MDVPLSAEARTHYRSGGTFLQRSLPFWLGVLAQRILLVLLPLAGVLYPLLRVIPASVSFVVEQRLQSLYTELRRIEARIAAGDPRAETDLAKLEAKVGATKVPRSGARSLYTLRQHVALVRGRLEPSAGGPSTP
ncbi:MAG TPA: hypothetical protein VE129_10830 [Thermoanaerobaculia bacterium]|nr:hypothetical protein [Thermoanaerobaculia bacterium]